MDVESGDPWPNAAHPGSNWFNGEQNRIFFREIRTFVPIYGLARLACFLEKWIKTGIPDESIS